MSISSTWRTWRFWLSCTISALCLWLAVRNVAFSELSGVLSQANPRWLVLAVVAQALALVGRAFRWVALLQARGRLRDSIWAQSIGYLVTNILPFRLGEVARVAVMAERCQLPVMRVAASAVVERLLDVATVVLALALILPWMTIPALVRRSGVLFGVIAVLAILSLLVAVRFASGAERVVCGIGKHLRFIPEDTLLARWRELTSGFSPLIDPMVAMRSVFWSLAMWTASIISYLCTIRAFEPTGTWIEATFLVVTLSFAVSVPSSPGFIGVFQLAGQSALVLPFGAKYTAASGLSITIAGHLNYYVVTTVLGLVGLWQIGSSLMRLEQLLRSRPRGSEVT